MLLEARKITKTFPGVKALDEVDFTLRGGQIHAVCGENGAGKSTLMKVIAGIYRPDAGELLLDGQPVTISTPTQARQLGISVIHQEFYLMNHLSVAQNIFFGREPKLPGGFINDDRLLNRKAQELLELLGMPIDPRVKVGQLSIAAQQIVEIAKALSFECRILIMDEPTAALSGGEVELLFGLIENFRSTETAVVYVSHRLAEIKQICDQISVLRDGQAVASHRSEELEISQLIQLMVGRELQSTVRPEPKPAAEVVLKVEGLTAPPRVKDLSFELQRGEILGFAGLMGAGRTETARALVGVDKATAGKITVFGTETKIKKPAAAVRLGIGYLSEDRKRYGLLLRQSVSANIALPSLGKFSKLGWLFETPMATAASRHSANLKIKTTSIWQQLRNLSGGNMQKVVLAKWLERDCDILIFDEPTRGIDVGAKQEIYDLLRDLTAQGKSIIMISSELDEILRMGDRIVVMCDGRITGVLKNSEATPEVIMERATDFQPVQGLK